VLWYTSVTCPTARHVTNRFQQITKRSTLFMINWRLPYCRDGDGTRPSVSDTKPSSHCPDETKRQPRDVTLVSYINDVLYVPRNVLIVTTNFFCKIVTTNFMSLYHDIDITILSVRPSVRLSVRDFPVFCRYDLTHCCSFFTTR